MDADQLTVEVRNGSPAWIVGASNPKVRRWDQSDYGDIRLVSGAVPVTESSDADPVWIDLEDGVQIRFAADREYRSGDYWLLPARVATGRLEWPEDADGNALPQRPRGTEHHYAPLGVVGNMDNGEIETRSCRCTVYPLSSCGVLGNRIRGIEALGNGIKPAPAAPARTTTKTPTKKPKTPKPPKPDE